MTSNIPAIEKFEIEGDENSLSLRWEKWKRAMDVFLTASNVTKEESKLAILLHAGGVALQDIFYNIPGAKTSGNTNDKLYDNAVQKLDEYFKPKESIIYERYIFRKIKQQDSEKFENFIIRLRNQAEKCKFTDAKEHIIDQITDKCCMNELRKRILLMKNEDVNLDKTISEGNTLEIVNKQLQTSPVTKKKTYYGVMKKVKCTRCGSIEHSGNDINCSARNKRCLKCGYIGHHKEQCKTSKRKRFNIKKNEYKKNLHKQTNKEG